MTRCIQCTRCVRFGAEIAGDARNVVVFLQGIAWKTGTSLRSH